VRRASKNDVLTLNLGGEKIVQRRRSTLCALEGSFLASRFSGRWDDDLDRDEKGNFFINYPPSLFEPVLDYLGTKETMGPDSHVLFPVVPEESLPHFQAMCHYLGLSEARMVILEVGSFSELLSTEVKQFAFGLKAKKSCTLKAIETCADKAPGAKAVVYIREGNLGQAGFPDLETCTQIGEGFLLPRRASKIDFFASPWTLMQGLNYIICIQTEVRGGVAYGSEKRRSFRAVAENEDLAVFSGVYDIYGFESNEWRTFAGNLHYCI